MVEMAALAAHYRYTCREPRLGIVSQTPCCLIMKACASVGARQVRRREAATVRQSRSAAGSQSHLGSPRSASASWPGPPPTARGTPALLRAGAGPEQHQAGQARPCSVRRTGSRRARCGRSWHGRAAHTSTPTWPTAAEPAAAAQSSTSPAPAPRIETRRSPAVSPCADRLVRQECRPELHATTDPSASGPAAAAAGSKCAGQGVRRWARRRWRSTAAASCTRAGPDELTSLDPVKMRSRKMSMTTLRQHAPSAAVGEVGGRLRSHHRRGRRGVASYRGPGTAATGARSVRSWRNPSAPHRRRRTRYTTADGGVDPVGLSRWVVSPGEAEHGPACPGRCPWAHPGVLRPGHGHGILSVGVDLEGVDGAVGDCSWSCARRACRPGRAHRVALRLLSRAVVDDFTGPGPRLRFFTFVAGTNVLGVRLGWRRLGDRRCGWPGWPGWYSVT